MHRPYRFLAACSLTLLATQSLAAQSHATDRGSIAVGGSASFTSGKAEGADDRTTLLDVRPMVQYFVGPGVAVGGTLTVGRSSNGNTTSTTLGIGPLLTFYFNQVSPTVLPFISAEFTVGQTSFDAPVAVADANTSTIQGAAGLLFMLSSSVGVNSQLFYRHQNFSQDGDDSEANVFGLAFGIAAFVF